MLYYREFEDTELVEITVDGYVSDVEFEEVARKLERFIARHGKVRLLEVVKSFGGMSPASFWEDMKFALRHLNDFSRCAVVTDEQWMTWLAKAATVIAPGAVKTFHLNEIDTARGWLTEHVGKAPEGVE